MDTISADHPFGVALQDVVKRHGRLCVGIDPHARLLSEWGLDYTPAGLEEFTRRCVDVFSGKVALVKIQAAFYEAFGSAGFHVLERAMRDLREAGTLVLADAKRGDIGSTNQGYADAWLGADSPLQADALTLSPYLGVESLKCMFSAAESAGAGLFVLARTSNPEGVIQQEAVIRDGTSVSVAQRVVDFVSSMNATQYERHGVGSFGVVVGATVDVPPDLSSLHGPVLLPGVGAQGGTHEDIHRIVGTSGNLGIPNVSRALLSQGPSARRLAECLADLQQDYFA